MKKLNAAKLLKNNDYNVVSSADALKDISPIKWPKEVLNGDKKVFVTNVNKVEDSTCVKLETSYL